MKNPKKFSVQPSAGSNSDINVTPLVDVVLVLLIIFMVVTPLMEKDIEVKVPDSEEVESPDDPLVEQQLVVSLDPNGNISLNSEKLSASEYVARLKDVLQKKKRTERLVFFVADDQTNYGTLVAAVDGAKSAGAELIGMMTETPPGANGPPVANSPSIP